MYRLLRVCSSKNRVLFAEIDILIEMFADFAMRHLETKSRCEARIGSVFRVEHVSEVGLCVKQVAGGVKTLNSPRIASISEQSVNQPNATISEQSTFALTHSLW